MKHPEISRKWGARDRRSLNRVFVRTFATSFGLTALCAAVGIVSLSLISFEFDIMRSQHLAEARIDSAIVSKTRPVVTGIKSLSTADDPDQIRTARQELADQIKDIEATLDGLAVDKRAPLVERLTALLSASEELAAARISLAEATAHRAEALGEATVLAENVNAMIAPVVTGAVFNLVTGGAEVSKETNQVISDLVEKDFQQLQAVLGIRSSVNLLYGAMTGYLFARDPAMRAMMGDLIAAARTRIKKSSAAYASSVDEDAADSLKSKLDTFEAAVDRASATATSNQTIAARSLSSARREIELTLDAIIDDKMFELTINSEDATTTNTRKIKELMEGQVDAVQRLLQLDALVNRYVATVYSVALAADPDAVTATAAILDSTAMNLGALELPDIEGVAPLIAQLLAKADPGNGIAVMRTAELAQLPRQTRSRP